MRAVLATTLGAAAMLASPGCAAVIFTLPAASGQMASPDAFSINFNGRAGSGVADFRIRGYASLDGADNGYTDIFTLRHNGVDIYSGAFNLGGGGADVQYLAPTGSRFTVFTPGMWQGGIADLSIPLALTSGINILGFRYTGNRQGTGDEAWGIDTVSVSRYGIGAVPEPASWAMLITGFGLVGTIARRRRRAPSVGRSMNA